MNKRCNPSESGNFARDLLIGLGERSVRKIYYPELQQRMTELERFRLLLDQAPDAIFLVEASTGHIIDANAAARTWYGHEQDGSDQANISQWLELSLPISSPDMDKPFEVWLNLSPSGCPQGRAVPFEISVRRANLEEKDFLVIVARAVAERKEAENRLLAAHEELSASYEELEALYRQLNNTEEELRLNVAELQNSQSALAESETRYRLAMEGSNDAIWDWDIQRDVWSISVEWVVKMGVKKERASDRSFWEARIHPDDRARRQDAVNDCLAGKSDHIDVEYRFLASPERWIWILAKGKVLFNTNGKPIRMSGSFTDVTTRKNQDDYIRHLAYHDFLTGLPNRLGITEAVAAAVKRAELEKSSGALFLLDLDNFKLVNDSWGHSSGDALLTEVAGKLRDYFPPEHIVARIGGDEFVILMNSVQPDQVREWAEKILALFDAPVIMRGIQLAISSSVGVASVLPGATVDEVLRNADMALHTAKDAGKKTWCLFKREMKDNLIMRMQTESELHRALATNELLAYYQPQIQLDTGEVIAFEALLRWSHAERGIISPQDFIPLAEETGLIVPMGDLVIRLACRFGHMLAKRYGKRWRIAVNVSARQIMRDDFIRTVGRILTEENYSPHCLEMELTESVLMESFEATIEKLTELRGLGIRIILDDFGTGYSSLTYLSRLPIDGLKIDRFFVQELGGNSTATAIAQAIINLAQQMNLAVIAEGVETEEQLQILRSLGCDHIQGFLFSRPLPVDEATEYPARLYPYT